MTVRSGAGYPLLVFTGGLWRRIRKSLTNTPAPVGYTWTAIEGTTFAVLDTVDWNARENG